MADGKRPRQGFHHVGLGEVVAHIAKAARRVEAGCGVVRDDPACFLAAMLQGVQTEGHKIRCIRDANDAEHATFFLQLIIVKGMGVVGLHGASDSGLVLRHHLGPSSATVTPSAAHICAAASDQFEGAAGAGTAAGTGADFAQFAVSSL